MVRQDNMVKKTICLIYGVQVPSDYGSSLVTGSRLVFSQCYVSDHFLVLFYAPLASLISFSIAAFAAGAGTIPSRASYIQSMLNTLISPHMIPLEFLP
jgi:hypothetical protein